MRIWQEGTKIWQDARSGTIGCIAGNLVLQHLTQETEEFTHEKGTIFSSTEKVVIGRVCSSAYLAKKVVHFSNISQLQHDSIPDLAHGRPIFYLLITVVNNQLHYWLIPYAVMTDVLANARTKKCDESSFIRIIRNGCESINGVNVTEFHRLISLTDQQVGILASSGERDNKGQIPISVDIDGMKYKGVLKPV